MTERAQIPAGGCQSTRISGEERRDRARPGLGSAVPPAKTLYTWAAVQLFKLDDEPPTPELTSSAPITFEVPARGADPAPFLKATPDEREHLANVLRLRTAMLLGSVMWLSFGVMDWLMSELVYAAPLNYVLAARFANTPLQLLFLFRLTRQPWPGPRALLLLDTTTFVSGAMSMAVLACFMGGIAGPYTPGVFLILICRNAFLVQPWRRSVLPNLLIVLAHFAVLGAAECLYPGCVLTRGPDSSFALLALHFCSLSCGAIMLTTATNTTWALRRRVFEARHLGRYRLVALLAEGGHGEVWRAYHPGMRQEVAIKVMRSEMAENKSALARFEREIDALCQLRHPHTIRILDYGVTADGVCYYAMELLEGVTLGQLARDAGGLPPARTIHLALQIANALSEAHQHGIVHRDIKPENVFVLSSDGVSDFAKLLDFGIAKRQSDEVAALQVTRTDTVVGTPAFMAPEVTAGHPADPRADVYGLGALIYFMLTGCVPDEPDRAGRARAIPPDLERVMKRCLAQAPDARYADAAQLVAALGELRDAYLWRPTAAPSVVPATSAPATPTRTSPPSDSKR